MNFKSKETQALQGLKCMRLLQTE